MKIIGKICKVKSIILVCSLIMVSACATTGTNETAVSEPFETPRSSPVTEKVDTQPEKKGDKQSVNALKPVSLSNTAQASTVITTRILPNERLVNVRNSPSIKSRVVAVLKGGHAIEVIEIKEKWLKVKWQKLDVVKQGWIYRRFVEGYNR